jgi:NAD(P)-dependent dehydrogenase (short-subunit alcohol dehydrogenase family)
VRSWIIDVKDRRIRINAISPGTTRTQALSISPTRTPPAAGLLDYLASTVPLGRIGEPEEIAKGMLFLASDNSSFVNGAELFVDGGQARV